MSIIRTLRHTALMCSLREPHLIDPSQDGSESRRECIALLREQRMARLRSLEPQFRGRQSHSCREDILSGARSRRLWKRRVCFALLTSAGTQEKMHPQLTEKKLGSHHPLAVRCPAHRGHGLHINGGTHHPHSHSLPGVHPGT